MISKNKLHTVHILQLTLMYHTVTVVKKLQLLKNNYKTLGLMFKTVSKIKFFIQT